MKTPRVRTQTLRATDPETARVVGLLGSDKSFVGAGCLIDGEHILTCYHVVQAANRDKKPDLKTTVRVKIIGMDGQPMVQARVIKLGAYTRGKAALNDLALLKLSRSFNIPAMEFATPLRHGGKRYSVLGFPDGDPQGRNASGLLHAANAAGLVQMDGNSALFVKGGFSGAPVWSEDLKAFVGIVVRELFDHGVSWCIPSRVLCRFYNDLPVRFRIPPSDRPTVHDLDVDDPNLDLFGLLENNRQRCLTAKVSWDHEDERFVVNATYRRLPGSHKPRGRYVTFITYPGFGRKKEDSYEMFDTISKKGTASTEFYPAEGFTIAAIGDAGDTVLTLNLSEIKDKPDGFE